jgi:hypothetical protein
MEITIEINKNFKTIIYKLLFKSNKLNRSFYIRNNSLIIYKSDLESVEKLLTNNYQPYSINTKTNR